MDLEAIASRAERAHDWIVKAAGEGDDGWLPLSVREVFKTDIPWLLAEVKALDYRRQEAEFHYRLLLRTAGKDTNRT